MNQKELLIIAASVASIFLFGEESQRFSLEEISVSSLAAENSAKKLSPSLPENYAEGKDIIIEANSKDSLEGEIAYPIGESNFEEVFGRKR